MVDNLLLNERRKSQRREKIFDGKGKYPVRHGKIAKETASDWTLSLSQHQAPEQYVEARELDARAYRIAERRAGGKGTAYLDALKAGETKKRPLLPPVSLDELVKGSSNPSKKALSLLQNR